MSTWKSGSGRRRCNKDIAALKKMFSYVLEIGSVEVSRSGFGTLARITVLIQWYCEIPGSRLWEEERRKELVNEAMYDDFGFFRDLYLFRAGVHVAPHDIWELTEILEKLLFVSKVRYRHEEMIEFALPDPIAVKFPMEGLSQDDTGLASLREVSRPGMRVGMPLRRIS